MKAGAKYKELDYGIMYNPTICQRGSSLIVLVESYKTKKDAIVAAQNYIAKIKGIN